MKGVSGNPALDAYQRMQVSSVTGPRRAAPAATEAPSTQPAEAAKVNISSEARSRATSAAEAQVDVQKVEGLKSKLREGSLQIDSKIVANRMLDHIG